MDEEREQIPGDGDDSFEALLKRAAHVSAPVLAGPGLALRAGTSLLDGRLLIKQRIGEGGMGVVYAAHDAQRRTTVALKTLNRLDAGSVYRLKNEFRSIAEVSHPHLCRLHELFGEGGQWFFTMELVEGERFDRWVRPGDVLDETRLRASLPQLCEAVAAIHAAGKLHRDLKPSNVLVTAEGRVVVLDFGLAADPEQGGVGQTVMDGSVSGTPAYMAPEQAAGVRATPASDFYALGAMLFEALTGRLPFEGRAHEMLTDKQRTDAPSASGSTPNAPADLDALCGHLLARDPGARPDVAALRASFGRGGTTLQVQALRASEAVLELFGRDAELRSLHAAYAEAAAGKPIVVFVSGESGMGKSALVAAFLDALRATGSATVLAGRCYERENVPFKGFDSVVDELSRHLRRLPAHEAAALLPREAYALARVFPVLDRIAVVAEAPKKDIPDPQDLKRRAFEAFFELLVRMRDRTPLVLFIDDVQWLDQDSVRFMRALFVQSDPVPVLLICAHRSEGAADNPLLQSVLQSARDNSALHTRALEVGPLAPEALSLLAERLLPEGSGPRKVAAFAEEAGGSPFFAGELARAAALRAPDAPLPSLADALALHVASLPPGAQRVLSVIALSGQPLSPSVVVDAADLANGHAELDHLRSEQLVRVSIDGDGARSVECYHDKIREHVTGALDALRIKELALGLSRALLADVGSDAELIARCLDLAGLHQDAALHAARAAEAAFAALAFGHAAKLYTHALDHGVFEPERARALRIAKAEALAHAGQGERAAEAFIAAAHGASTEQADELTRKAGEQYLMCGDLDRGRALVGQALRRVGIAMPLTLGGTLAALTWSRTRLRLRGLSYTPRTDHDPMTLQKLDALQMATHCLARTDQVRAADFCARWVLCALDAGHELALGRAIATEVLFASYTGASEEGVRELIAFCERLCDQSGDAFTRYWLLQYCGLRALMRLGRSVDAVSDLDAALEVAAANPLATTSHDLAWTHFMRAAAVLLSGRLQEGGELAQTQLEAALARGDNTVTAGLAQLVVLSMLAADRPDQADRIVDAACARLYPGEVTLQDFVLAAAVGRADMYRGDARAAWRLSGPFMERLSGSFHGRVLMRGELETMTCGIAAAAARQVTDQDEKRQLIRSAARFAKRAKSAAHVPTNPGCPDAVLACLRGDRAAAVRALRHRLALTLTPMVVQVTRRRLGVLLDDDEGRALVSEADAFLRAGGVIDPVRFSAALAPGIEL